MPCSFTLFLFLAPPARKRYFLTAVAALFNLVIVAQLEAEFPVEVVKPVSAGRAISDLGGILQL
jgi:hypothetical protein